MIVDDDDVCLGIVFFFFVCVFFFCFLFCFFCFQAEDGIRDLVRSRGLGDVYKRQRPLGAPISSRIASAISM